MTFILAFILSVLMRKGIQFANYALGALFIWMGYIVMHMPDETPGLISIIGYASMIIGLFLLFAKAIFKSVNEKTK